MKARTTTTTTRPPVPPPFLFCPVCERPLEYTCSYLSGAGRQLEQWDLFSCTAECGQYEYRQRTREVRRVPTWTSQVR